MLTVPFIAKQTMRDRDKHRKDNRTKHSVPKVKKNSVAKENRRRLTTRDRVPNTNVRDVYNPVSVEEFEKIQHENERLRQLNKTIQRENNKVMSLARDGRLDSYDESFKATVVALTKQVVYPRCPYVSNPVQLDKCMLILASELALNESKKRWFCVGFKHTVNGTIAAKRNSDIQCMRREMKGNVLNKKYCYVIYTTGTIKLE